MLWKSVCFMEIIMAKIRFTFECEITSWTAVSAVCPIFCLDGAKAGIAEFWSWCVKQGPWVANQWMHVADTSWQLRKWVYWLETNIDGLLTSHYRELQRRMIGMKPFLWAFWDNSSLKPPAFWISRSKFALNKKKIIYCKICIVVSVIDKYFIIIIAIY